MNAESDFERDLKALRLLLWECSRDLSYNGLAANAGLAWGTVHNLLNGDTKSPQFRSVYKLARACGVEIRFDRKRIRLRKVA